jgi:DNA repair protein SbcD/Mre11
VKFPYTADWHVGKTLKGSYRLDEQKAVLAEIAEIAEVIVIADNRHKTAFVLVAEADGNRTRQRRGTPLSGFEDQGDHQEPRRLRRRLY